MLQSIPNAALDYVQVGPGHYVKWNPILGIRTTTWIRPSSTPGKVDVTTKHEQRVEEILDLNVSLANDFSGYRGKELVQATRIPITEHRKIMTACGFQRGHGYDQKKFARILNDPDYRKFKVIPGKL